LVADPGALRTHEQLIENRDLLFEAASLKNQITERLAPCRSVPAPHGPFLEVSENLLRLLFIIDAGQS
jgi:hypothetical protein